MRILFVGDLREHTRTHQRCETLRRMGADVQAVSTHYAWSPAPSLVQRAWARLGHPADRTAANAHLLELAAAQPFDVLWVEKAAVLRPRTLLALRLRQPQMRCAFFSEDDMMLASNRSRGFRRLCRLFDVVFTTKSYNAFPSELPALGARKVVFVRKTFDPTIHRPLSVDAGTVERLGGPVTFIGTFERDRFEACRFLARAGLPLRVWGEGWGTAAEPVPGLRIEGRGIYGEDYVRAVCASDVNLGFLRRESRDRHTDRSVEIPACEAFLLAERTGEHLELFREGLEAAFFGDPEELLAQVRHWLDHPAERVDVARAGRARCVASDYSHAGALERMLAALGMSFLREAA